MHCTKSLLALALATSFLFVAHGAPAPAPAPSTAAGEPRCQAEDGTLLPTASACEDKLPTCKDIFKASTATTRDPLCDNPDMQDKAGQCAKTCLICCEQPEYNCDDSPRAPFNCTTMKRYCKDANWTQPMSQYCPATCGLCNAGACSDAINGCKDMKSLCDNYQFHDYMLQNCKKTCDTCTTTTTPTSTPPGACSDIANNCAQNINLCTNSVYYSLMTEKCPRTCNRCGVSGGTPPATCSDNNASCGTWNTNGFCASTFYTAAQKRQYCPRTCNMC